MASAPAGDSCSEEGERILNRALILDRDGVINVDTGFLHRIEECRFVDGIAALLRFFAGEGFRLVIATNQSGIGRGLFTEADYQLLMGWMTERFRQQGIVIDRVYHAPDAPDDPAPRFPGWRKPAPGMVLEAIRELDLDPAASWAIGDRMRDLEAAEAAGIPHRVLFDPTIAATERRAGYWAVPRLADIPALYAVTPPGGA